MIKKQKTVRDPNDFYPTPYKLARFAVANCMTRRPDLNKSLKRLRSLEPSSGDGVYSKILLRMGMNTTSIEPFGDRKKDYPHLRTTLESFGGLYTGPKFDLIIGNPPYKLSMEHIKICMKLLSVDGIMCMLLPMSFLASKKRVDFWNREKCSFITALSERPSFSSDGGTTAADYGLFHWTKTRSAYTLLEVVSWK